MPKKLIIFIIVNLSLCTLDSSATSLIEMDSVMSYKYMLNKLGKGWSAENSALVKEFSYDESDSSSRDWENSESASLKMDFKIHFNDESSAKLGLDWFSGYTDSLWQPVSHEKRIHIKDSPMRVRSFEFNYVPRDSALKYINYERGYGHYNWLFEGDLFYLYKEQFETDRYLRISGRSVPDFFETKLETAHGDISIVAGPEVVWGYKNGGYIKYDFSSFSLIHKNIEIPYGTDNERMNSTSLTGRFLVHKTPMEIGLMYQPFRLGEEYEYVEKVSPGLGIGGSEYELHSDDTSSADAIAGLVSLYFYPYPYLEQMKLTYSYAGLVAGNKQEIKLKGSVHPYSYLDTAIEFLYRKPLIEALPLVYTGSLDSPAAILISPRGPDSPFWVGWDSNEWDNRQASIFSLTMTFDPGDQEWFYKYEPNKIEKWNINPEQDSDYAAALNYTISYFPTSTDRLYHEDANGDIEWDPYFSAGVWGAEKAISEVKFAGVSKLKDMNIQLYLNMGQQFAASSSAYLDDWAKPSTTFFTGSLSLIRYKYSFVLSYYSDAWGIEEWHREFGQTYDKAYKFDINYNFAPTISLGLSYVAARENDYEYMAPEMGTYDEVYMYINYGFGSKLYID